MAEKRIILTRKKAILLIVGLSLLLYSAGLLSGLATNKVIKKETQEQVDYLTQYVNTLDSELRSVQIQEAFVASLDPSERCGVAEAYFKNNVAVQLNYYWNVLPSRIEQYEQGRVLSKEYLALKEQYTKLNLRAWLAAKNNAEDCGTSTIPILYFYSRPCDDCGVQGQVLDVVKDMMQNSTVLVFTIDKDQNESSLGLIREYYGVTSTPALVVNGHVLQGRVFSADEIVEFIGVGE